MSGASDPTWHGSGHGVFLRARTRASTGARVRPTGDGTGIATQGEDRMSTTDSPRTKELAELAELLHETGEHHDAFEKASAPHNWWDWYAPYLDARQRGATPADAEAAADRYMEEQLGVVAQRRGRPS